MPQFAKKTYKGPARNVRSGTVAVGFLNYPTRDQARLMLARDPVTGHQVVDRANANSLAMVYDIAGSRIPATISGLLPTDPVTGEPFLTSPQYEYGYSHTSIYPNEGQALAVENAFQAQHNISIHEYAEPMRAMHRQVAQQNGWPMPGGFPLNPHIPQGAPRNLMNQLNAAAAGGGAGGGGAALAAVNNGAPPAAVNNGAAPAAANNGVARRNRRDADRAARAAAVRAAGIRAQRRNVDAAGLGGGRRLGHGPLPPAPAGPPGLGNLPAPAAAAQNGNGDGAAHEDEDEGFGTWFVETISLGFLTPRKNKRRRVTP